MDKYINKIKDKKIKKIRIKQYGCLDYVHAYIDNNDFYIIGRCNNKYHILDDKEFIGKTLEEGIEYIQNIEIQMLKDKEYNNSKNYKNKSLDNLKETINNIIKIKCRCDEMDTICDRCKALSFVIHAKDSLNKL